MGARCCSGLEIRLLQAVLDLLDVKQAGVGCGAGWRPPEQRWSPSEERFPLWISISPAAAGSPRARSPVWIMEGVRAPRLGQLPAPG